MTIPFDLCESLFLDLPSAFSYSWAFWRYFRHVPHPLMMRLVRERVSSSPLPLCPLPSYDHLQIEIIYFQIVHMIQSRIEFIHQ